MRLQQPSAPAATPSTYRPDLDGLRAVAILAVILFHCDVPGFSGGFVGVDVFFVISGYLITSQILRETDQGRFSLMDFWMRRARRIVPALAVMTATCLVVGWFLFFPVNYRDLGRSAVATAGFASNVFFWFKAGYFTAPAETKPLLHTWSVSIEEQFYLVIPLILAAVARLDRRVVVAVLGTGLVASLMIAWRNAIAAPEAAFYLIFSRGWELLVGCLLGSVARSGGFAGSRVGRELLAGSGLAGVLVAVSMFVEGIPWPAPGGLVPCLGAAAIIHAGGPGLGSRPLPFVTRLLSWPPLVGVGLISYSLYLWHWPLLAFARYAAIEPLSPLAAAGIAAAAVPIAWVSYVFVELPARRSPAGQRPLVVLPAAAVVLGLTAIGGGLVSLTGGMAGRAAFDAGAFSLDRTAAAGRNDNCLPVTSVPKVAAAVCRLGPVSNDAPKILLVGDSFADMYHGVFTRLSEQFGRETWFMRESHAAVRTAVADVVRTGVVADVVLAFSWRRALEGGIPELKGPERAESGSAWARSIGYDPADLFGDRTQRFRDDFGGAVEELVSLGARVFVVDAPPYYSVPVPLKLAIIARRGGDPERLRSSRTDHDRLLRDAHAVFDPYERVGTIRVIRPVDLLCDEAGSCRTCTKEHSYYADEAHLSEEGAEFVSELFIPVFQLP